MTLTDSPPSAAGADPGAADPVAADPVARRVAWWRWLVAQVRHRGRRTPDRLVATTVGLVLLGCGTGLVALVSVRDRAAALDEATGRGSRLSLAAVTAYQSLSDADATAASGFLAAGAEPPEAGARYAADLAQAAAALSTITAGAPGDAPALAAIAEVAGDLPVYAGRMDAARAYNRQSLPLGAAYLREASTLLRDRMLPAAQRLYDLEADRLARAQHDGSAPPWFALTLGVATLAALVAVQLRLTRATNRLVNLGLLAATAATLAALAWLTAASVRAAGDTGTSRRDGTAQIDALARARIAALQARGDEALTLVARGNGADLERQFTDITNRLGGAGGLLAQAADRAGQPATRAEVAAAQDALRSWLRTHTDLRRLDDAGSYSAAVVLATGSASTSSASLASTLDAHLGAATDQAGARFARAAGDARGALSGVGAGTAVLLVGGALAAAAGLWPRIAEYR